MQDYSNANLSLLLIEAFDNVAMTSGENTTLAGYPAFEVMYESQLSSLQIPLMTMQTLTLIEDKAYILTFTAEKSKYVAKEF